MGDKSHHQRSSSRLGLVRNNTTTSTTSGEIVEVPGGGHIVRSLGRKDRHSKVCTAKGPRDRRVRLAAHTAIQFYDVQDRLGYDRPSKAVDWLITKAKAAIDELAQLPPWHPTGCNNGADHHSEHVEEQGGKKILEDGHEQAEQVIMLGTGHEQRVNRNNDHNNVQDSGFFTPQLDSDAIADTIKSFFPTGASAHESTSSAGNGMQFTSFSTHHHDLISRTGGQSQDLNLSLQSFQDPILMHNRHQNLSINHSTMQQQLNSQAQVLLSGTPLVGFVNGNSNIAWSDHQSDKFQSWNNASTGDLFGSPPMLQQLLGQNQFLNTTTQRGPLQSSNYTPSIRAWMDQTDIHHHQQQGLLMPVYYPSSSVPGIGFASGINGFAGFHVPARIQGEGEERNNDGYSDKPSSASSDSHSPLS